MPIPYALPLMLMEACAPEVAPITLAAIVQQESGGDWLAIHDNTAGRSSRPATVEEAVILARHLIAEGHSVDLGAAQINSANLPRLGLDIDSAFQPCANLRAAQTLLLEGWQRSGGDLSTTLAVYHTGCANDCSVTKRSVGVAYSASVYAQAGVTVPAIPEGHLASWVQPPWMAPAPRVKTTVSASPEASSLTPRGGDLPTRSQANSPQ